MKRPMMHAGMRLLLAALAAGLLFGERAALGASAEKGRVAYVKHGCWGCHGFEGQGSVASSAGKVLAPDPLPFEAFAAFVRSTNRTMPPYSETMLPNEDLADIYAFLQTIPKPKDYKSIPLLNQ